MTHAEAELLRETTFRILLARIQTGTEVVIFAKGCLAMRTAFEEATYFIEDFNAHVASQRLINRSKRAKPKTQRGKEI